MLQRINDIAQSIALKASQGKGSHTVAAIMALAPLVRASYEATPAPKLLEAVRGRLPFWLQPFLHTDRLAVALPYIVGSVKSLRGEPVPVFALETVLGGEGQ